MSKPSTSALDSDLEPTSSWTLDERSLHYAVTHMFLPVKLPDEDDYFAVDKDHSLARAVCTAAHAFSAHIDWTSESEQAQWHRITKMVDNLQVSVESGHLHKDHVISQLCGMQTGDILTFFSRPQNAAIILTKGVNSTLYESLEVSPNNDAIEKTSGSLICSYPQSAVEVPNEVFDDANFQSEFANFLSRSGAVDSDFPPPPPPHSQWITALLTGIMRSVGRMVDVPRITKRLRGHVSWSQSLNERDDQMMSAFSGYPHGVYFPPKKVWRRSSLWLLIRVAIQMSVDRSHFGRATYKAFMLFVMCTLARDADRTKLSSDLLHLMSSKILRRLRKFGSSTPSWLSEMTLKTCTRLQETLDDRLKQLSTRSSLFRNPSQDELIRDSQLSLLHTREYINSALANFGHRPVSPPVHPSRHPHGTIEAFLSSDGTFFEEAYAVDPDIAIYEVEKAVEQGIDGWLACVTDVDEACAQLEILMDAYMIGASRRRKLNPEDTSMTFLTAIELFVALDKLVVKEIPMLADYSPEIPIAFLEKLLLRKAVNLHRLCCAYQYLAARHSRSHPGWSALSNQFTADSFPVRYYDQTPHLRHLKARIEQDTLVSASDLQRESASPAGSDDEYEKYSTERLSAEGAEVTLSPLPTSPLQAKAVVFELQCPTCFRIWRSAAPRFLFYFYKNLPEDIFLDPEDVDNLLELDPELQSHFVERQGPPLYIRIHCLYSESESHLNSPTLHYAIQHPSRYGPGLSRWWPKNYQNEKALPFELQHLKEMASFSLRSYDEKVSSYHLQYQLERHNECLSCKYLAKYVLYTFHTPNDVLSAQADCPADLSLDEFITFAHLRSGGGSLQWVNILRGLRSRTLNFHRHQVHFLLAQAAFQVGPLDLNRGTWIWHQELQDSSFCHALLDELHSLFVDVGTYSFDALMMSTISLLLTRVLASSPSEDVSERAIKMLRSVRRKTFNWVQELSYNLAKAPTNEERRNLLRNMAAACRSTFDVDPAILRKLFHSAEDVDALLSCAFFIHALDSGFTDDEYSQLLLGRDRRLSFALEETLRDAILADVSDRGVDFAVSKIFASYQPSTDRWEPLEYPNAHWLTCRAEETLNQPSRVVHFNLLGGGLRVDGQPLGGLPRGIMLTPELKQIFCDQGFFVLPSNLPGMDFTTLAMTSKYQVHFSLRDNDDEDGLVIRAQCNKTGNILELIPSEMLQEDLPPALVDGHVHWLNLSTKIIEIRPLALLWEESSQNWKIDCASGQYRMHKGNKTLVDIRSPTWEMVAKCFECLNGGIEKSYMVKTQPNHLLITVIPISSPQSYPAFRLSVDLPHYSLSFYANEREELESRDFKDMVYDENRCIGTLIGLESLLVLRQRTHLADELIFRRILIPNGSPEKRGDRIQIRVDSESSLPEADQPLYHAYIVDTEMGCLTGNGSLTSVKYLAHLHALTSYHQPDPLTGKTGAQAALCLLQSVGCRSFTKLKAFGNYLPGFERPGRYPQIDAAYEEIRRRHRNLYVRQIDVIASEKRAARRAVYLFPWNSTEPEDCDDLDCSTTKESDVELEDVVSTVASAIHRWSFNAPTLNTILAWGELWCCDESNFEFFRTLIIKVRDILDKKEGYSLRFQLLFQLPTAAYCSPSHQAAFLSMLLAFAKQFQSRSLVDNPPIFSDCNISDGYRPSEQVVYEQVRWWPQFMRQCSHPQRGKHDDHAVVKQLLSGWPCDTPSTDTLDSCCWEVESLTASLKPLFSSCYRNFKLKEHLMRILAEPGLPTRVRPVSSPQYISNLDSNERTPSWITLEQLFSNRPAPELPPCRPFLPVRKLSKGNKTLSEDVPALDQLFSSLQTDRAFQREYLARLGTSAQRVRKESQMSVRGAGENLIEALKQHYVQCRADYMNALATLKQTLGPTADTDEQLLERFGQWPPITADVLLRYLASTSTINLTRRWKKCFVSLALLLLSIQRARRMLRFALDGHEEELSKELKNEGCDGWDAEEHPDWLLIQIQGNFLIRRAQAETAKELISPRSAGNTVMQLNMGEGKSSVIIPIAAVTLADGNQLVRVIVPKALTVQMFELLVDRLSGLANRPIYHSPFSRTLDSDSRSNAKAMNLQVDHLHKFMSQCMAERGILLVQPEHVISLKLMGVEQQIYKGKLTDGPSLQLQKSIYKHVMEVGLSLKSLPVGSFVGKIFQWLSQSPNQSSEKDTTQADCHRHSDDARGTLENASKWLSLQKWIHSHVRDIMDESDEILHPRFQLVYTIGPQQQMDGYPDRWTITQQILHLVKERAYPLSRNHPDSVEYEAGPPGSFPHIRIGRASDVGRHLVSSIVEDVMAGRLPNFNFQHISPELQDAIRSFISDEDILQVPETAKRVEQYAKCSQQNYLWGGLLLLRGLLASNILLFTLIERRWRVDYGLQVSPQTTKRLAIPYRAKDMPAANTQFGHPDIAIILTCLSYYYGGLTEEQLRVSFELLLNQDNPSTEYAFWIEEYDRDSVPDSLQKLGDINLRSSEQWDKVIFPFFARNKAAIDLYLSRVVFPKEAKEFPWKLAGSSWDLAEKREKPITGFSGTHDGRWLLPMTVAQRDLDHQQGTDAMVLAYLLKSENGFYMVTHKNGGERQTTFEFLQMVAAQEPKISVLLDVGAQILDLSNRQVAKAWLGIVPDISGAIYFNENDQLVVCMQNGITLPLSSSPLSQRLDRCVVYLDHAHTRGTDITLPVGSRAAVTLGPKVTKDRLVQGCMRMRKLGHGHSVMFFAPVEVDQIIRALVSKKDPTTRITAADVLCWTINETWTDIQQRAPHWAQQGMNHKSRYDALSRFFNDEITPEQISDAWLQPECKSLADLYEPDENAMSALSALDPAIRQRCKDLGVLSLPQAQMEEEQEREVSRESERERDVELPPKARPEKHFLHQDVVAFVKTGVVPPLHSGSAFRPVFTTLETSSAASREADVWSPSILATMDFCTTIKPESTRGTMDQYLRPVQWILSRKKDRDQVLVLLSPFEADCLLPDIRASKHVHLHVYVPRTCQHTKPLDDLNLYSIPPLPSDWSPPWALIDQLNVFAGQLYLRDYTSYLRLCRFLGVPTQESPNDTTVRRNVFHIPGSFEEDEITFVDSPLSCVKALLAIRNRGLPFSDTHMGKIFQGKPLTKEDF